VDFLRMIAEVVEHRDVRVAGDLGALRADLLIVPEVLRRERLVALRAVGAQQYAAVRVEGDRAADVWMLRDEGDQRVDLRLAGRERARALLLDLLAPVRREIPVQIEPFLVGLNPKGRPVPVLQYPFRQQAVVS